jgi:nitrate reductase delta subunit
MTTPGSRELQTQLIALARLLEYPGVDFATRVSAAPSLASLACFSTAMLTLSPDDREELYTATFDVTPACVAYVSIHLFGEENFKRGEFMARLHERYSQAGFSTSGELPDHLSVLLRFVAATHESERQELTEFCLLGPLGKMIAALTRENPYRALLATVREVLQAAYPDVKPALSPLEQMQQHGAGCAAISAGCSCGAMPDEQPLARMLTHEPALTL